MLHIAYTFQDFLAPVYIVTSVVGTLMVTDFKWSAASVESKNGEKNKFSFLFHAELLSGCCGLQNLKINPQTHRENGNSQVFLPWEYFTFA
jgi:hypothetical protein